MPRIAAALGVLATVAFCIGFNIQRYPVVWQSVAVVSDSPNGPPTVARPLQAIAGAIRAAGSPAPLRGISQPIPLPQVAASSQPIPAPGPAFAASTAEPVSDLVVARPAGKYAAASDGPEEPVAVKAKPAEAKKKAEPMAKPQPVSSKPKADTAKAKPPKPKTESSRAKAEAAKAKTGPDKVKVASDKPKAKTPTAMVSRPIPLPKADSPQPAAKPAAAEQPAARVAQRRLVPVRRDAQQLASAAVPGWNTSRSPWSAPDEPQSVVRRLPPVDGRQLTSRNPYAAGANRIPFYPTTGM